MYHLNIIFKFSNFKISIRYPLSVTCYLFPSAIHCFPFSAFCLPFTIRHLLATYYYYMVDYVLRITYHVRFA